MNIFHRRKFESDMDAELAFHIETYIADLVRSGLSQAEAKRRARIEFGALEATKDECRQAWGFQWIDELRADLRFTFRTLRQNPGFAAVAVLSLALGIGANTAIFTLVDNVMLRQVPVRELGQLVELLHRFPGEPPLNGFVVRSWRFFEEHNDVFDSIIGMGNPGNWPPWSFAVKPDGSNSEWVTGVYVTGNYFDALGVNPALGRLIAPQDSLPGAPGKIAVISWRYWKDRFHGDPSLPGKQVVVDEEPAIIAGVAPRGFAGLHLEQPEDIWVTWASAGGPAASRS